MYVCIVKVAEREREIVKVVRVFRMPTLPYCKPPKSQRVLVESSPLRSRMHSRSTDRSGDAAFTGSTRTQPGSKSVRLPFQPETKSHVDTHTHTLCDSPNSTLKPRKPKKALKPRLRTASSPASATVCCVCARRKAPSPEHFSQADIEVEG